MNDTKTFPLVLTIPFHAEIKETSKYLHMSMNLFIKDAIIEKIQREQIK